MKRDLRIYNKAYKMGYNKGCSKSYNTQINAYAHVHNMASNKGYKWHLIRDIIMDNDAYNKACSKEDNEALNG